MKAWSGFFAVFALLVGVVWYSPRLAFEPGPLSKGHQKQSDNCASCHVPFEGAGRCESCHKPKEFESNPKLVFHHQLAQESCNACHKIHGGGQPKPFKHELLPKSIEANCVGCHARPNDQLHRPLGENCANCHHQTAFKPAQFVHKSLPPAELSQCTTCHEKPADRLHQKLTGSCQSCHGFTAFKPAQFEHDQYFRFDRHHPETCDNCHQNSDYSTYTCYGCHEHSPGSIAGEHREEGIRNFEDCANCHASGDENDIRSRRSRSEADYSQPAQPSSEPVKHSYKKRERHSEHEEDEEDEDDD